MITRDIDAFIAFARTLQADFGPATARAAFLVSPDGFVRADQSAQDNRYMADAGAFDAEAALREHHALHRALSQDVPVICFPGDEATPDAVFPNNVFATARVDGQPRLIVGRMRHPVRQREAARADIRGYFNAMGYAETDLSAQPSPGELTGALVIDRARGIGFCGLSERCDEAGAAQMHAAFGLRATLMFDLAAGEYHTNVLLAVLAGRAALVCPHALQGGGAVAGRAGRLRRQCDRTDRSVCLDEPPGARGPDGWRSPSAGRGGGLCHPKCAPGGHRGRRWIAKMLCGRDFLTIQLAEWGPSGCG